LAASAEQQGSVRFHFSTIHDKCEYLIWGDLSEWGNQGAFHPPDWAPADR
jgi:hypothetical protein